MENFNPGQLGIQLPPNVKPEDFANFLEGTKALDYQNIDLVRGLNPGKFGPMNNPNAFSDKTGFSFDPAQGFKLDAPPNPADPKAMEQISQVVGFEQSGKFQDALNALNTVLQQQPDALLQAYAAQLELRTGDKKEAVQNIEKAIAMSPNDPNLYTEAGRIFKESGVTGPKVFVNGVKPDFDVQPFIEKSRTLVPFRALAETMGAQVQWDEKTKKITMVRGDKTVEMTINSTTALVDGKPIKMDVAPKIVNNRTVIPLRFMGEGLDTDVSYDQKTEIIKVMPKTTE
jgi:tetratricopeptide (TPR) repeat protein